MKKLLKLIQSLAVFITVFLLCLISAYGSVTPDNVPYSIAGYFRLAPFANGLSLYQPNRNIYYAFSPLNDYFIVKGNRKTLISSEEYSYNAYKNDMEKSKSEKIKETLFSYFMEGQPEISYIGKQAIRYSSIKINNGFTITREFTPESNTIPEKIGMTILYKSGDYVFDETGNLYSYKTESEIDLFYQRYGFQLKPTGDELLKEVYGNKVCLVNPNLSGVICLAAAKGQTVRVNRNSSLIEVEQIADMDGEGKYNMSVQTVIADSSKEAFKI